MADTNINITASPIDGNLVNTSANSSITISPYTTEVTTPGLITETDIVSKLNIALVGYGEESVPTRQFGDTKRESLISTDTLKFLANKAALETATASETFTRLVVFNRTLTETATATGIEYLAFTKPYTIDVSTVTETVSSLVNFQRAPIETATTSEVLIFNANLVQLDTTTTVEALVFNTNLVEFDTATATDTTSSLIDFKRTFTDTVTGTDDFDGTGIIDDDQVALVIKSLQDNSDLTDTETFNTVKVIADLTTAQELFSSLVVFDRNISETNTTADTLTTLVLFNRVITDTTTTSEALVFNTIAAEFDTATASETFTRLVNFNRNISDTTTTQELVTVQYGLPELDTATTSETFSSLVVFNRNISETNTTADTLTTLVLFNRIITDTATTSEALVFNTIAAEFDTATASETFTRLVDFNRNVSDTTTTTDIASTLVVFNRSLTETTTAQELLSFVNTFNRSFTETNTTSELFTIQYTLPELDTTTATDVASNTAAFNRVFAENTIATDDFDGVGTVDDDQVAAFIKNTQDFSNLTDSKIFEVIKALTADTATAQEFFSRAADFNRSFTETNTTSEIISSNFTLPRTADTATTSEALLYLIDKAILTDIATASDSRSFIFELAETETATADEIVNLQTNTFVDITETAILNELKIAHYNDYNIDPDYMELLYVGTELTL